MWCLCACPRKPSNDALTLPNNVNGNNNNNANSPVDTNTNINNNTINNSSSGGNPLSGRRRSSGGYVQLIQDHRGSNDAEDGEMSKFLPDCTPDLHSKVSDNKNKDDIIRKKRKVLFNLRPSKKKDCELFSSHICHLRHHQQKQLERLHQEEDNKHEQQQQQQQQQQQLQKQSLNLQDNTENFIETEKENVLLNEMENNFTWEMNYDPLPANFPRRHSVSAYGKSVRHEINGVPINLILPKLTHVREGLLALAGNDQRFSPIRANQWKSKNQEKEESPICCYNDVAWKELAKETLEEFEWCLLHLSDRTSPHYESSVSLEQFKTTIDREFAKLATNKKSKQEVISSIKMHLGTDHTAKFNFELNSTKSKVTQPPDLIDSNQVKTTAESFIPNKYMFNLDHEVYRHLGILYSNFDSVDKVLDGCLDFWGLQIFEFDEITNHHPLVVMVMKIFSKRKLMNLFSIDPSSVFHYFLAVESEYDRSIPYHNAVHAADVTQSIHVLLSSDTIEDVFTELEILCLIFACAIHDVQHPGVTNQFLINIGHELAVMYNDISVLENHHLAVAFRLLQNEGCDVFSGVTRLQRQTIRKLVIDLVLATDMSRHMTLLTDLKAIVDAKRQSGSDVLELDGAEARLCTMQNMIHCADLSNPTKPLPLYQEWTHRIMEEFFRQGDRERTHQMAISPMCDRDTASIEKSQVSFIDFIVRPLWNTWAQLVFPSAQPMLDTLAVNREWYHLQLSMPHTTESVVMTEDVPGPVLSSSSSSSHTAAVTQSSGFPNSQTTLSMTRTPQHPQPSITNTSTNISSKPKLSVANKFKIKSHLKQFSHCSIEEECEFLPQPLQQQFPSLSSENIHLSGPP